MAKETNTKHHYLIPINIYGMGIGYLNPRTVVLLAALLTPKFIVQQ
jgi:hypothetical protein